MNSNQQPPSTEHKMRAALQVARGRIKFTLVFFLLPLLLVLGQLVHVTVLQRVDDKPSNIAANTTEAIALKGTRANIVDRNGQLLATSLPTVSLYADALKVIEPERTADELRSVFPNLSREKLIADFTSKKRFIWLQRHLTPQEHNAVLQLGLPGIMVEREARRIYPQGNLLVHVLGYTDIDQNGLAGVESTLNSRLSTNLAPLQLSIDLRVQHILRREIQATIDEFSAIGGAGLVMDSRTGEVLAFVSLPDYDPHNPASATDEAKFNRNTLGIYELGSTFKIFNTALALESGKVQVTDSFDCTKPVRIGRFTINDFKPENRWLSVPEILVHSSNIGSLKMFERVGVAGQQTFMQRLGLTTQSVLEIPERGTPLVPKPWREINGKTISFGHGIAVSPLHLVRGMGAMVNDGVLMPTTLLRRPADETVLGTRVISSKTSATMRQLMRLVVTEGTSKAAEAEGYIVGGKTGTSEKLAGAGVKTYSKDARLSSFIGAFPMNDPRYVIFIMIDEPKGTARTFGYATGGWTAAPAVGRVIAQIAPILGLAPAEMTMESPVAKAPPGADDASMPQRFLAEPLDLKPVEDGE